jgi:hypothetical protein
MSGKYAALATPMLALAAMEQVEKNHELPAAFQKLESLFDSAGSGVRRVPAILTVR